MTRICVLLTLPIVLLVAACGSGGPSGAAGTGDVADEPPPASAPTPGVFYAVDATVLENRSHGSMLCIGAMALSYPPQCGDIPIANWDWDAVEGEERAAGTTWGMYRVESRYDGAAFEVTDVGPSQGDSAVSSPAPDTSSPCPEPAGGWSRLEDATQNEDRRAHRYARSQPDYVTSWVTHLDPARLEFSPVVVNAVFTGDRERHEAEIRKVWPGPLCVVERDAPTTRELDRIRKEVEAGLDELGLQMLWSAGPAIEPVVEIGVVVDPDGNGQATLDARYGSGVVRIIPLMQPAEAAVSD